MEKRTHPWAANIQRGIAVTNMFPDTINFRNHSSLAFSGKQTLTETQNAHLLDKEQHRFKTFETLHKIIAYSWNLKRLSFQTSRQEVQDYVRSCMILPLVSKESE